MEILLSFTTGLVLVGIVAFFALRSVKSSAADALTKALDDAAEQADAQGDQAGRAGHRQDCIELDEVKRIPKHEPRWDASFPARERKRPINLC